MNPEEFAAFVKTVISEEVTTTAPCSCCGTVEIEGVEAAAARVATAVAEMIPPASTEKCGRCGGYVSADQIAVTGPYRTCPPCTTIIRS